MRAPAVLLLASLVVAGPLRADDPARLPVPEPGSYALPPLGDAGACRELDEQAGGQVFRLISALERLGESAKVTVRLNPEDHQRTGAAKIAQVASASVSVVADNRIPRGGCRVESDMGILDAGIDAQLHEIAQALLGRTDAPVSVKAA